MTLTVAEASAVLLAAQLLDNRNFDQSTAEAWATTIDPEVTLADALAAIRDHYAKSDRFIMPFHIHEFVKAQKAIRKQRIKDAGPVDFPPGLTFSQEQEYRRNFHSFAAEGFSREDAINAADKAFGASREIDFVPPSAEVRATMERFTDGLSLPKSPRPRSEPNE